MAACRRTPATCPGDKTAAALGWAEDSFQCGSSGRGTPRNRPGETSSRARIRSSWLRRTLGASVFPGRRVGRCWLVCWLLCFENIVSHVELISIQVCMYILVRIIDDHSVKQAVVPRYVPSVSFLACIIFSMIEYPSVRGFLYALRPILLEGFEACFIEGFWGRFRTVNSN